MNFRYLLAVLLCTASLGAQSADASHDAEPAAILEIGPAAGWDLHDGRSGSGPNFAAEFTPIENRLEIEVTPICETRK